MSYSPVTARMLLPARRLSVASLVLGLAGVTVGVAMLGIPSIAAVVLGHLALSREPAGRREALGGLVLGYAGILFGVFVTVLIVLALVLPFAWIALFPPFTAL